MYVCKSYQYNSFATSYYVIYFHDMPSAGADI